MHALYGAQKAEFPAGSGAKSANGSGRDRKILEDRH
jgi:hypothetical protein